MHKNKDFPLVVQWVGDTKFLTYVASRLASLLKQFYLATPLLRRYTQCIDGFSFSKDERQMDLCLDMQK